ncbi:oxygen-insensitive NAD(P)H nitroreductase [Bordetella genomosp. 1]|uniref:NAD(P)H nitroreductase n=1 Tax=Bordetella genomosp. 1 TaxID=1395607 RepID=A0ABX4F1Q1_9BORD|nr:oxygen-insensitive NAD(P)H nitroreductase [Bordetella genomosp. 1]OZI65941.1 NAD(P)H nitroreductase [Bordetella genomosp. 1]
MNIAELAQKRYTTKSFDPARKLSAEHVAQIEALLHYSPSSTNAQPWHFFIAGTEEGRAAVARGASGFYAFNEPKIRNASHVVVFCTRAAIDDAYLEQLLDQEQRDARFASAEARAGQQRGRAHFVNAHRYALRDAIHWMEKQVYLAVGTLLLGAAALGIDACPMEGFDADALDQALGLRERGLVGSVIVSLGYHSPEDFNAHLPKSRLPLDQILTRL